MTTTEIIKEQNKLIDDFMGKISQNLNLSDHRIDYNNSWDMLMPVVEKICAIKFCENDTHYLRTFGMKSFETDNFMVRFNGCIVYSARTLHEATYNAVVDFVKHQKTYFNP